jgi:hypothetical protein
MKPLAAQPNRPRRCRPMVAAAALSTSLFAACDPGFELPSEVGSSKLMGVRLEVEGAPERAWPRVGENFSLRWLVARANQPSTLDLEKQLNGALSVCVGTQLPGGSLFCAQEIALDELMLKGENTVTSFEELVMPLQLPFDPRSVAGGQRILLFGAVCVEGKVERVNGKKVGEDPANELYRCTDNDKAELKEPLAFTNTVIVDFEDDAFAANLNPAFACDADEENSICQEGSVHDDEEKRGGAFVLVRPKKAGAKKREVTEWPEVLDGAQPLPWEGCAKDPRFDDLQIEAGADEHLIRIRFDPSDRERYDVEELKYNKYMTVNKREELLVSHAATKDAVELGRYYSLIPREQPNDTAEVELDFKPVKQSTKAGKKIPDDGKLVRFYFVVRDQRGGVDLAARSLCLVPERAPAKDP